MDVTLPSKQPRGDRPEPLHGNPLPECVCPMRDVPAGPDGGSVHSSSVRIEEAPGVWHQKSEWVELPSDIISGVIFLTTKYWR